MPDTTVKIEDYLQELEQPQPDIMQEWQASKKPVYDIIMSRYPKPEKQIDPETERKAKFAAQLSDGLTSIGEMFAHGTGARVKSRAGQPTSTGTTNASLKAAADKYEQSMDRYLTADSNAKLQDLNMYMSQAQQERGEKRKMYLYQKEQEAKAAAAALAARKQKETERHNRAMENKPTGADKDKEPKTLPVFIGNKQYDFPADLQDKIVSNAIKDGIAGKITKTIINDRGIRQTIEEKVTPMTSLTKEQKRNLFESVYNRYIRLRDDGGFEIIKPVPAYVPKPGEFRGKDGKIYKTVPKQMAAPKTSSGSLY